jgi:hypothetical protein
MRAQGYAEPLAYPGGLAAMRAAGVAPGRFAPYVSPHHAEPGRAPGDCGDPRGANAWACTPYAHHSRAATGTRERARALGEIRAADGMHALP